MGLVVAYIHREVEALNKSTNNNEAADTTTKPTDAAVDTSMDGPSAMAAGGGADADVDADIDTTHDPDTTTDETSPGSSPSPRAGAGNGSMNAPQLTRIRDAFLDLLVERTHDVSPWTRANVLKVTTTYDPLRLSTVIYVLSN